MGNKHFGNLADVFKHLALAEMIANLRPTEYWESHAGAACYPEIADIPAERVHGIHAFHRLVPTKDALRLSAYARVLGDPNTPLTTIPGSPLLARKLIDGNVRRLLLCDTDANSLLNIRDHFKKVEPGAKELGADTLECVQDDGVSVLRGAGMTQPQQWLASTIAFLDPYDLHAVTAAGISSLMLACELANRGIVVVAFYGFKDDAERAWQKKTITQTLESARLLNRGTARFEGFMANAAAPTQFGFGLLAFNIPSNIQAMVHTKLLALQNVYERSEITAPAGNIPGNWQYNYATF